jgi:HK97 family phage major capsid protein
MRTEFGKTKAFTGPAAEERAESFGHFVRAAILGNSHSRAYCGDHGIRITRAQSEGVNSGGGFLVPAEMAKTILALREQYGAMRGTASYAPMARDAMNWPRRTGGYIVFFPGEGGAATASDATFDGVHLVAKKMTVLVKISTELEEDAAADFGEFFAQELAWTLAKAEDGCGFNGDGTSTYGHMTGVITRLLSGNCNASKIAAASGHATFATLDGTDLANLLAAVPAVALPGARWFVSQFGFATTFARLAGVSGGDLDDDSATAVVRRSYLGFPIQMVPSLPQVGTSLAGQVMALFGDMSLAATFGDRRQITIMRSEDRYMDTDQIGVLGTQRVDINTHDLGDNSTAGPIVGLVGTS